MRSEEIRTIQEELDTACSDLCGEIFGYKKRGDEDKYKTAQMASQHLISAYLELMNAIILFEVLEGME